MTPRVLALPLGSLLLVGGVLGVQVAQGGGDYVPQRSADPCVGRTVTTVSTGLDALSEQLVLLGLDGAACRLHETREELVLQIADSSKRKALQTSDLRGGLLDAVDRLDRQHKLPKVSQLSDEAIDQTDLPGLVKSGLKAVPDSAIDKLLPTAPLLRRSINRLDIPALLDNLDDPGRLQAALRTAIIGAAREEIIASVKGIF